MDNGTTIISMVMNTGFAIAVATYLLLKTNNTLQKIIKTICRLKKRVELLSERIGGMRK